MSESRVTVLGTPCSGKWEDAWVARVDEVEAEVGHRVCGAHSPAWTPCKLVSTHVNGRCRFHGGAEGIGAPLGNRNAIIHGLYSRRLQRCGKHCPMWFHCPMAGQDVLDLNATERPTCAYEKTEYDELMSALSASSERTSQTSEVASSDADASDDTGGSFSSLYNNQFKNPSARGEDDQDVCDESIVKEAAPSPIEAFLHHNITTFQIMLTRAQAAMGVARMVEETHANSGDYSMTARKMSSMLQAEMRIARELRQWLKLLAIEPLRRVLGGANSEPDPDDEPRKLGWPELMVPILEKAEGVFEACLEPGKSSEDEYGTA